MVVFVMLSKMVLNESVDKILKCHHLNKKATEQYFPVVLFIMLLCVSNFQVCG